MSRTNTIWIALPMLASWKIPATYKKEKQNIYIRMSELQVTVYQAALFYTKKVLVSKPNHLPCSWWWRCRTQRFHFRGSPRVWSRPPPWSPPSALCWWSEGRSSEVVPTLDSVPDLDRDYDPHPAVPAPSALSLAPPFGNTWNHLRKHTQILLMHHSLQWLKNVVSQSILLIPYKCYASNIISLLSDLWPHKDYSESCAHLCCVAAWGRSRLNSDRSHAGVVDEWHLGCGHGPARSITAPLVNLTALSISTKIKTVSHKS